MVSVLLDKAHVKKTKGNKSEKKKGESAKYRLLSLPLVLWEVRNKTHLWWGRMFFLLTSLWQRHCAVPIPGDPRGHVATQASAQVKATNGLGRFLLFSLGTTPCGISAPITSSF